MSEKQLLLSEAKIGILVKKEPWKEWLLLPYFTPAYWWEEKRRVVTMVWILLAVIGLVNLFTKIPEVSVSANPIAVGPGFAILGNTATSTGFIPTRMMISAIGVDAKVEQVGIAPDGSMANPSSFKTIGFYNGGSQPGEGGNAVFDGHVNNALTSSGVFEHLDALHVGDTIVVQNGEGKTLTYIISNEQLYDAQNAPLHEIFARTGPSQLVLITCNGAWDQGKREFDKRLVVYATLRE